MAQWAALHFTVPPRKKRKRKETAKTSSGGKTITILVALDRIKIVFARMQLGTREEGEEMNERENERADRKEEKKKVEIHTSNELIK